MTDDWNELFDEPTRNGEALVENCEAESDIPYEEGREALRCKGREVSMMEAEPIDIIGDNEDGRFCMFDFIASDIEYLNGKVIEGSFVDKMKALSYKLDIGYEDDEYMDVDVYSLFDCKDCPLQHLLNRMECYEMKRRGGIHGWFFPFDMRTLRFETNSILKEHINHHISNKQIVKVKRMIDGKKVSGFFIKCIDAE